MRRLTDGYTSYPVHTIGGIVTAAQPLGMIVPEQSNIEVEAWVANKDIGFVYVGQPAEVKVEIFKFKKFGTMSSEVVEFSPDAVEDKDTGTCLPRTLAYATGQHFR